MQHDPAALLSRMWDVSPKHIRRSLAVSAILAAVPAAEVNGHDVYIVADDDDRWIQVGHDRVTVHHPGLKAHPDRHVDAYAGQATIQIHGDLLALADAVVAMLDGVQ